MPPDVVPTEHGIDDFDDYGCDVTYNIPPHAFDRLVAQDVIDLVRRSDTPHLIVANFRGCVDVGNVTSNEPNCTDGLYGNMRTQDHRWCHPSILFDDVLRRHTRASNVEGLSARLNSREGGDCACECAAWERDWKERCVVRFFYTETRAQINKIHPMFWC